jgi:hypothetical protein
VEEVAGRVVDGIRANTFWLLPSSEQGDAQLRARAASMLDRENPTYMRTIAG